MKISNFRFKFLHFLILLTLVAFPNIGKLQGLPASRVMIGYVNHDPINIVSDDDFVTLGFPGSGTELEPYKIENLQISPDLTDGIFISDTSKFFIIQNCYIEGIQYGIYLKNLDGNGIVRNNTIGSSWYMSIGLYRSSSLLIENNTCSPNSMYGIDLSESTYNIIKMNNCSSADDIGIRLHSTSPHNVILQNICSRNINRGISVTTSNNITISGNICQGNKDGIWVANSDDINVFHNNLFNNSRDGMRIKGDEGASGSELYNYRINVTGNKAYNNGETGLYGYLLKDIVVFNNEIIANNDDGISFTSVFENEVCYNLIQSNKPFGMDVTYTRLIIHNNRFISNGNGSVPQAEDEEGLSYWYDTITKKGNYWSDWSGSGSYQLAGAINATDLYPLSEMTTSTTTTTTPVTTESDVSSTDGLIQTGTSDKSSSEEFQTSGFLTFYILIPLILLAGIFVVKRIPRRP